MSTETEDTEDELRERITNFLRRNFPQIQMHGGSAAIQDLDREEGSVHASTGMGGKEGMAGGAGGMSPSFPGETTGDAEDDEGPEAPF
ncbi:hypothetical protein BRC73_05465 [Halobacteriales archaeon QH_7_66_37]|nr:MAG: hypothetical protein BRC73_05465 [Halobacteriales archaeon QH_7_66_37]